MDLTESVDIYCERLGPGLFAEPLNAVTNAAFFLAAWAGLAAARRGARTETATLVLIGLLVAIGIGSTLFHTVAQRWAAIADTTPIMLFILTYLGLAFRRYFGTGAAEAVVLTLAFVFFSSGFERAARSVLPEFLHGSSGYFPALLALLVCGGLLRLRGRAVGDWLLAAGAIFAVSLTFRSIDGPLCDVWPIGTHFVWHVLNAVVLGVALFAWLRHGARPVAEARAAA